MLKIVAEEMWEYERHLTVAGVVRLPRRTTVVRLPDGSLWVHNVNELVPEARAAVDALGPVRHVVAPNKFHHFWVDRWKSEYPEATVYAARGLPEKRPELPFDVTLEERAPEVWGDAIDLLQTEGCPLLDEVAFFHRPSRSLILTDWIYHVGPHEPALTRLVFRIDGCYRRLWPGRLFRLLAKDRARVVETVDEICRRWDFVRVVMAHGQVTEVDPAGLRAAFSGF